MDHCSAYFPMLYPLETYVPDKKQRKKRQSSNWVKLSMANWRYAKMEQLGQFVVAHNREPHGSNFKRTGDVKTYE
jgi:hypothetical protein